MKAVIFSCSIKDGKNSDTQAWSELFAKSMNAQDIQTEIINLKKFDYEASTGPDLLHEEMAKCYDADFITIAGPVNFRHPNFYLRNLAKRFAHAHNKAKAKGIDLFENKLFEICIMLGCLSDNTNDGTLVEVPYGGRQTRDIKGILPPVKYINETRKHLLSLSCWNPSDKIGPKRKELHLDEQTMYDINVTINGYRDNYVEHTPKFSLETWMDCFKSEDPRAFGRGYTLSADNLSEETITAHRKWVNENFTDAHKKAQIFVAMKERCIKADYYEGAEMYFDEQFELGEEGKIHAGDHYDTDWTDPNKKYVMAWKDGGFRITRAANYRPNNY
jgi:hypothetical protein